MEEIKIVPTEQVESQEYIDSMVAKSEQATKPVETTQPTETVKEEPLILGKFKSQEDLVKSYQELEKKLSSDKTDVKPNTLKVEQKEVQQGFDFSTAEQEFNETGELSETTIQSLEAQGISKKYIDTYVNGLSAIAQQFEQQAYNVTQGEDNYKQMQSWINQNLAPEEVEIFNKGVSADDKTALFTIKNMYARYSAETREPNVSLGQTAQTQQGGRYESLAQMKADMRDPKYSQDPAFRKMVADKISRSSGII